MLDLVHKWTFIMIVVVGVYACVYMNEAEEKKERQKKIIIH